jgi:hypothetical protein
LEVLTFIGLKKAAGFSRYHAYILDLQVWCVSQQWAAHSKII